VERPLICACVFSGNAIHYGLLSYIREAQDHLDLAA
jgi:hypothetical protein